MSILIAENLTKNYGHGQAKTMVLQNASIAVGKGEFITILGPSGSGKSTLLNLCGLLESPDSGQIFHKGLSLGSLSQRERTDYRREHLGFVFQSFNLVPVMTVAANVGYPLMLLEWSASEIRQRVMEVLTQVGLEKFADKKPEQLSGGQCQRVAIARALVKRPSIIIADEPTASLDTVTAQRVVELIKSLAKDQGAACLIATHDQRLLPFSDQVLHIESGQIVNDTKTEIEAKIVKNSRSIEGAFA